MEINQYDVTMPTHYDITMGNGIARDAIVKTQWVMVNIVSNIHCDVTISNNIMMCRSTYCGITMHNDVAMNIFYLVFSAVCLIMLFYYW